ncbi:MAG: hypothetical protein ACRYFS_25050 [Janthinobacterium lividum]
MRNGIHFNKLTLVDNSADKVDDAAVYYPYQPGAEPITLDDAHQAKTTLLIFVAVSIACTAAAVATGSYAVWLSRQQAAHRTLTDVNDILRSCQTRMHQLESDLQRLPNRLA